MQNPKAWLLGVALLVVGIAGAGVVMQARPDPRLVGTWIGSDQNDRSSAVCYRLSGDGNWGAYSRGTVHRSSWDVSARKSWFVRDSVLIVRMTYPLWSTGSSFRDRFDRVWSRVSEAARGNGSLIPAVDERFQLETAPNGEITLVAIAPNSADPPPRYRKAAESDDEGRGL